MAAPFLGEAINYRPQEEDTFSVSSYLFGCPSLLPPPCSVLFLGLLLLLGCVLLLVLFAFCFFLSFEPWVGRKKRHGRRKERTWSRPDGHIEFPRDFGGCVKIYIFRFHRLLCLACVFFPSFCERH